VGRKSGTKAKNFGLFSLTLDISTKHRKIAEQVSLVSYNFLPNVKWKCWVKKKLWTILHVCKLA